MREHRAKPGIRRAFVCLHRKGNERDCWERVFLGKDPFHGGDVPGDFIPECPKHGPMVREANRPYRGESTEPLPEQGWPEAHA